MVTKEQEEDFKRRRAAGPVVSDEEKANRSAELKLTKSQYKAFLKSTDSKCNGDS